MAFQGRMRKGNSRFFFRYLFSPWLRAYRFLGQSRPCRIICMYTTLLRKMAAIRKFRTGLLDVAWCAYYALDPGALFFGLHSDQNLLECIAGSCYNFQS